MNEYQRKVATFMRHAGQEIGLTPALRDRELRAKLIMEEAVETVAALGFAADAFISAPDRAGYAGEIAEFHKNYPDPDFEEVIDGLCDLLYVTFGAAVTMGIDLDPFFDEVHRANIAKLGGPKREDGKQLKPEGWQPPNHRAILEGLGA